MHEKSSTFIARRTCILQRKDANNINDQWGKLYIEHFRSDARGISIFFVKDKEFNIHKEVIAEGGHLIIIDIEDLKSEPWIIKLPRYETAIDLLIVVSQ